MSEVQAVPEGFGSATPHLVVRGCADAIAFYERAFGAREGLRMPGPGGQGVMYAELKIGDSIIMIGDEMPQMTDWVSPSSLDGTTAAVHLYVEDVDAAFQRAIDAGARPKMPPTDMFWGDRYSLVLDPFGHAWSIATHKEDLTPEQIGERAEAWFAQMMGGEPES